MSKSSLVATTRRVRGFTEGRSAVLTLGFLQGLSAISLFVFAACVAAFVRSSTGRLPSSGRSESTL
jgi:hypothetical protein